VPRGRLAESRCRAFLYRSPEVLYPYHRPQFDYRQDREDGEDDTCNIEIGGEQSGLPGLVPQVADDRSPVVKDVQDRTAVKMIGSDDSPRMRSGPRVLILVSEVGYSGDKTISKSPLPPVPPAWKVSDHIVVAVEHRRNVDPPLDDEGMAGRQLVEFAVRILAVTVDGEAGPFERESHDMPSCNSSFHCRLR
jgi:hypothetical protein